jgi:nicotinate-nucleotide adenylyltransferase
MQIGIFGGTFDPVHLGHLILAETAREAASLDEVWFVPAFMAPHKQGQRSTPARERIDMLRLALAGHSQFRINDLEIRRRGPSFTVETLQELKSQHPDDEFLLLIGGDSLADFPTWRDPQRILELVRLVAVNRGRDPLNVEGAMKSLGNGLEDRIITVEMPAVDLSATEIRQRCRTGKSIRSWTPRAVELFIHQHRLYESE